MPIGRDAVELSEWVEISDAGTATVLRIAGELDVATREAIEPVVLEAAASRAAVVIDLERLTFCDSNGIALLVEAHRRALARGTSLSIRNVSPRIGRLFDLTGLSTVVDTSPSDRSPRADRV